MWIFFICPCVSTLYLLHSVLCLKGSGWVQIWEHSSKRSEGREWSSIFVRVHRHQGFASPADGQSSCLVWLTSQNQEFFTSCPFRPRSGRTPSCFSHRGTEFILSLFPAAFPTPCKYPFIKVLVCLLLGPTFCDSCGIFAGYTHPAARRKLGSSNAFIALFMLDPHHGEGSWFWLPLNSFWKITLLHLNICLSQMP